LVFFAQDLGEFAAYYVRVWVAFSIGVDDATALAGPHSDPSHPTDTRRTNMRM
jgi:hypothetical protein